MPDYLSIIEKAGVQHPLADPRNPLCQRCTLGGSMHAHHVIPRREGGTDEPTNLIKLCSQCHYEWEYYAPPNVPFEKWLRSPGMWFWSFIWHVDLDKWQAEVGRCLLGTQWYHIVDAWIKTKEARIIHLHAERERERAEREARRKRKKVA